MLNADKIISYAIKQSEVMANEIDSESFQLILGDDCSLLIVSAIAFKKKGNFGLFYLDGHTDYSTPAESQSHSAGMDQAIVCGIGHPKLTNILNLGPYIEEKNVFCVGNREHDIEDEKLITNSQIQYVPLERLRKTGIRQTIVQFIEMIETNKLDGFYIHFDVDVLNDNIMPAVDSRQADGLSFRELQQLLLPLLTSPKMYGMQITILDPDPDPGAQYTKAFISNISPLILKVKQ
ncbi:arginase family protein [Cytophagaceae bacterium DM2B3-1]|uniref:Arginase family protein n=1 Tax=Xanthocytophaga flava TaxID=3048013 RepID=A0ABT7CU21_9BACT|nr:arginase family protein [Xanthocytophaga flavus]MDJ1497268.1 arginase family protein [Xanthocytophaga flavus]